MKVKSESEVTQSCPTPSDPMDCSPPGSSIHGIFWSGVPLPSPWRFLKTLKMNLESHSWAYIWRKTWSKEIHVTPAFAAALFTITKTWKQPKYPLAVEIMPFAATWMDLEIVILSEVSQTERNIWYDTHYTWNLEGRDTN